MQFLIYKIGKTAKEYQDLESKYLCFLGGKFEARVTQLTPTKARGTTPREKTQAADAQKLTAQIDPSLPTFVLSEHGKPVTSLELATKLAKKMQHTGKIQLLIGGAYGLPQDLYQQFEQLSLSTLTLPHDLAYIVLLEQLYRATTIWQNKSYHY